MPSIPHTKLLIAVGSTRRPKLDAVRDALNQIGPLLCPNTEVELIGREVPSDVRHTPLSRHETMAGARQRAEALLRAARENSEPWEFCVGLEGGVDIVNENGTRHVFLENWAYVLDSSGRGSFGQSGAIALPPQLANAVVDHGIELAAAIDTYAGQTGIRDAQGAWGVLTRNLITRQESYRIALISAFSRFLAASSSTAQ